MKILSDTTEITGEARISSVEIPHGKQIENITLTCNMKSGQHVHWTQTLREILGREKRV